MTTSPARPARAFLDPTLNLGWITRQRAHDIIVNDFILAQGLLPPEQLAEAVNKQFIPAHKAH